MDYAKVSLEKHYEWKGKIGIRKRPAQGLLAGLYEFPSEEGKWTKKQLSEQLEKDGVQPEKLFSTGTAKHIFSHVEWHMKGFYIKLADDCDLTCLPRNLLFVTREELQETYMLPVAFHYYLQQILDESGRKGK